MMRNSRTVHASALLATLLLAIGAAGAADDDVNRLGKDLTPSGAEKAGNKDGSIPAWTGSEAPTSGWAYGKFRGDHWRHKDEKPLFSIDAGNVDKYKDKLSPGQVALVKGNKGYRMDVYPSHRSCGVPDFVADNTKKNVGVAKIGADGWTLADAIVPGYPFPFPKTGTEVIYDSKMRYRGVGVEWKNNFTAVSPRKGGSDWITAGSEQTNYYPWGAKGSRHFNTLPDVESFVYFAYNTPTALAGQGLTIRNFLNKPGTETFYYFPGQRRVRRMPAYAYDAPQIGFENQYTLDEPFVFNGPIDRFDWKLVGKKELYVPYNSFGLYKFDGDFHKIVGNDYVNNEARRYELHRVYVVEATVKNGTRHSSPKKVFYVDEDSYNLVAAEDYDGQGKMWKVKEGYTIPVYETGTCDATAFAQYNLLEGRYVIDEHAAGTGKDMRWVVEPDGQKFKESFYTSDNLRAISER
jgi:hypothetical protein